MTTQTKFNFALSVAHVNGALIEAIRGDNQEEFLRAVRFLQHETNRCLKLLETPRVLVDADDVEDDEL